MSKSLEERIREVESEQISIVAYDPSWPEEFAREAITLREMLPSDLMKRIEHFGSTAVAGLAAKPIIDILVEVRSLEDTKEQIVPALIADGYEYFWRPTIDDRGPLYAWFIKRNSEGKRTHHIHMVEAESEL